jgi:hypothetical protein
VARNLIRAAATAPRAGDKRLFTAGEQVDILPAEPAEFIDFIWE